MKKHPLNALTILALLPLAIGAARAGEPQVPPSTDCKKLVEDSWKQFEKAREDWFSQNPGVIEAYATLQAQLTPTDRVLADSDSSKLALNLALYNERPAVQGASRPGSVSSSLSCPPGVPSFKASDLRTAAGCAPNEAACAGVPNDDTPLCLTGYQAWQAKQYGALNGSNSYLKRPSVATSVDRVDAGFNGSSYSITVHATQQGQTTGRPLAIEFKVGATVLRDDVALLKVVDQDGAMKKSWEDFSAEKLPGCKYIPYPAAKGRVVQNWLGKIKYGKKAAPDSKRQAEAKPQVQAPAETPLPPFKRTLSAAEQNACTIMTGLAWQKISVGRNKWKNDNADLYSGYKLLQSKLSPTLRMLKAKDKKDLLEQQLRLLNGQADLLAFQQPDPANLGCAPGKMRTTRAKAYQLACRGSMTGIETDQCKALSNDYAKSDEEVCAPKMGLTIGMFEAAGGGLAKPSAEKRYATRAYMNEGYLVVERGELANGSFVPTNGAGAISIPMQATADAEDVFLTVAIDRASVNATWQELFVKEVGSQDCRFMRDPDKDQGIDRVLRTEAQSARSNAKELAAVQSAGQKSKPAAGAAQ